MGCAGEDIIKQFADREYISPKLFDMLFEDSIHLGTGIKANMRNRLMPMWDKIMLRRRCVIETINDILKKHCPAGTFKTQVQQLHHEYDCGIGSILILRQ